MSATTRVPAMTRDQFFDWAETQGARYEFDGFQPVAMTGGNLNHNRIAFNIHTALRGRLKGSVTSRSALTRESPRPAILSVTPMGLLPAPPRTAPAAWS